MHQRKRMTSGSFATSFAGYVNPACSFVVMVFVFVVSRAIRCVEKNV